MARPRRRIPLNLFIGGILVGQLRQEASGAIDFRYNPGWLLWEGASPVSLSLPLREDRYLGEAVLAVFDNLLPDNETIRRRLAERTHAGGSDAFSLLSAIGRDCVGALQFLPEGEEPGPVGAVSGRPIDEEEIARILGELGTTPLGVGEDAEFRISLAGAQEKTALLYWEGRWHIPHGTTATTHIMKPRIGKLANGIDLTQSVENEHLCMMLTRALGLSCAHTEIREFGGKNVLVVERFDRRWAGDRQLLRLPQEDCCQALSVPPTRKYEPDGGPGMKQIAGLLKASDAPKADQRMFFKAQIVFWLMGATDGHAKNFSIRLDAGGRFRLAPLYDVMSAQPNVDAGQIARNRMKLAMAVGDNRHYVVDDIVPRHFLQTAKGCGIAPAMIEGIFEEIVMTADAAIDKVLKDLPGNYPGDLARSITQGMRRRLRLIEAGND